MSSRVDAYLASPSWTLRPEADRAAILRHVGVVDQNVDTAPPQLRARAAWVSHGITLGMLHVCRDPYLARHTIRERCEPKTAPTPEGLAEALRVYQGLTDEQIGALFALAPQLEVACVLARGLGKPNGYLWIDGAWHRRRVESEADA